MISIASSLSSVVLLSNTTNGFNPMMFMFMNNNSENPLMNMFDGAFNFGVETESEK